MEMDIKEMKREISTKVGANQLISGGSNAITMEAVQKQLEEDRAKDQSIDVKAMDIKSIEGLRSLLHEYDRLARIIETLKLGDKPPYDVHVTVFNNNPSPCITTLSDSTIARFAMDDTARAALVAHYEGRLLEVENILESLVGQRAEH